ncbi:electron carrier/ protein disulfide oxidoreductase [Perilla frutescens var. frutescens]|nr:electron carrier/ protein disulfide oxidoreductase [Perilla frutescens var. frutescens]
MEKVSSDEKKSTIPSVSHKEDTSNCGKGNQDIEQSVNVKNPDASVKEDVSDIQARDLGKEKGKNQEEKKLDDIHVAEEEEETVGAQEKVQSELLSTVNSEDVREKSGQTVGEKISDYLEEGGIADHSEVPNKSPEEVLYEEEEEPVFDGTEVPGMEGNRSLSSRSSDNDSETQGSAWPDKAVALSHYVKQKSLGAMSTVFRRLSGKSDDGLDVADRDKEFVNDDLSKGDKDLLPESVGQKVSKSTERSGWNPLSLIGISHDAGRENKSEQEDSLKDLTHPHPIAMKGRIILYTRLGCQDCTEARRYLQRKGLKYVEINIDVYPSRKLELEKIAGSSTVPRVFFNEILIGGLSELKKLEDSGKLGEKIEYVVSEEPSYEAPLPPLSGEDDLSSGGVIDELALIVQKMKGSISIKDRFYKMRRYTDCFQGKDAVDFLSEDQYLEREDAVEFGRKLADKLFFQHVALENIFEDGNHLYRFLDDDPVISRCQNIPRGIIEVKPKPITNISSRLRFLLSAILEAYTSEDGKRVDYMSIHESEEFARYLRIAEELQRAELYEMPREEKLSFFINLYNMMAIHAILVLGPPSGALDRRKFLGEFKYVIGGSPYSLSAIYNGVLRGNQRPPYNLTKPFGVKDKRLKVALPYVEPLVHFALVSGTQSGPDLRCYSPGSIDKELMDAACSFLRNGGLYVDLITNVAYPSKILKWYSIDFGKNEVEVLKHAVNYMEPSDSQALLDLLSNIQLKVIYQTYDWGLNN